ncbi:MAG: hypothetical protein BVN35_20895 [Proteobacteria bacterium ST_bin11]|nr:MAG: hypothetical protein BVN35_20895 [Proteobacteria bacterium ST_bin11]
MRQSMPPAGDHIKGEVIHFGVIDSPPWQRAGFFTYGGYWQSRQVLKALNGGQRWACQQSMANG